MWQAIGTASRASMEQEAEEDTRCMHGAGGEGYEINIMESLLSRFPEVPFHKMFRVKREEFESLVEILEGAVAAEFWGPVRGMVNGGQISLSSRRLYLAGNPQGGRPARPARQQIAVALYEFGSDGNDRERDRVALNISSGSTYDYTNRVVDLLLELAPAYIRWPPHAERISKSHNQHPIFRTAVGFLDGSELPLRFRPKNYSETYFSRHKQYGFQLQAVCDWEERIVYAYAGNQASVQDSTAFRYSSMWQQREQYFSDEEYLIADKGYFTHKHLLIPYKEPTVRTVDGGKAFNLMIAKVRKSPEMNMNAGLINLPVRNELELNIALENSKRGCDRSDLYPSK
jgi:hypothetical protein